MPPVLRVIGGLAFAAALALVLATLPEVQFGLDYFSDASASIDALARGDVGQFLDTYALMGSFSLILRAPFVALVYHQPLEVVYLAGAIPCVAAVVALALALRRRMRALGRSDAAVALVVVAALLSPGVLRSLHWGHPEELLAGAMCVGAALAATRGRWIAAGLLLGLAVATKQWALVAVIPVVLAATRRPLALALIAGFVAAALTAPFLLAAPDTFVAVHKEVATAGGPSGPANVWWPISEPRTAAERELSAPGFAYEIPAWLSSASHPLIVLLSAPLGLLFWRRRKALRPEDALGLLALLLLLRCLLDPWNNDYYHAPFLLALLAYEAIARSGWPRLTVAAGAALTLTFPASADSFSDFSAIGTQVGIVYLAWAVPLAAWLALSVFWPALARGVAARGLRVVAGHEPAAALAPRARDRLRRPAES